MQIHLPTVSSPSKGIPQSSCRLPMGSVLQETGNGSLSRWVSTTSRISRSLKQPARFTVHPKENMWAFNDKRVPRRLTRIIPNLLRITLSADTLDTGMQQVWKIFKVEGLRVGEKDFSRRGRGEIQKCRRRKRSPRTFYPYCLFSNLNEVGWKGKPTCKLRTKGETSWHW